jgi:hypothetical protein
MCYICTAPLMPIISSPYFHSYTPNYRIGNDTFLLLLPYITASRFPWGHGKSIISCLDLALRRLELEYSPINQHSGVSLVGIENGIPSPSSVYSPFRPYYLKSSPFQVTQLHSAGSFHETIDSISDLIVPVLRRPVCQSFQPCFGRIPCSYVITPASIPNMAGT